VVVHVERDLDISVPKDFGHDLRRDTTSEQSRR
jgi:hypothetical protein